MEKNVCLKERVGQAIWEERRREDRKMGRGDGSGYESYGRLKEAVENAEKNVKPLGGLVKDFWEAVCQGNDDAQIALLREIYRQGACAAGEFVRLASTANRAKDSVSGAWEMPEDAEEGEEGDEE